MSNKDFFLTMSELGREFIGTQEHYVVPGEYSGGTVQGYPIVHYPNSPMPTTSAVWRCYYCERDNSHEDMQCPHCGGDRRDR